jgi:hypothetical protein
MVVALAAWPSGQPLGTGRAAFKAGPAAGAAVAWPANGVAFEAAGVPMALGTFNLSYRFILCAFANLIFYGNTGTTWTRYDYAIQLYNTGSGATVTDLNGASYVQNADSRDAEGGAWSGSSLEYKFYCEASINYGVRLVGGPGSGANGIYYQHAVYLNFGAYTVGEGVY